MAPPRNAESDTPACFAAASQSAMSRAYKDIDAVMAAQTYLVNVVHTLKQIVCVKG